MNLVPNTGNGMKIDANNKLSINFDDTNIHVDSNGLYVDDLNVIDGTTCDGYSVYVTNPSDTSKIDVNRDVVTFIYSYGVYAPYARGNSGIVYRDGEEQRDKQIKTASDIVNEMNKPLLHNANARWHPNKGELLQLITNPAYAPCKPNDYYVETGGRSNTSTQETQALFYISDISYDPNKYQGYYITELKLMCIYTGINTFEKGEEYTGDPSGEGDYP